MSTFEVAILTVLKNEGGFVNDPDDTGGATNHGISLKWLLSIGIDADVDYVKNMSQDTAIAFYKTYWWDKGQFSRINDQSICTKLFDLSVNEDDEQANKLVQRACWSAHGYGSLTDDGVLGELSIAAINNAQPTLLLAALRSEAAGFYRTLAAEKPSDSKFLNGWLQRAYQ